MPPTTTQPISVHTALAAAALVFTAAALPGCVCPEEQAGQKLATPGQGAGQSAGTATQTTGQGSDQTTDHGTAQAQPIPEPVLLPVPADPTISYNIWFKVGSQDDPAGKEGLAWVTGQMLAEGSTLENSYQDIIAKLFPMAASYQVRVDREMTTLTGRAHRDHAAPFQALLADAYAKPAFKQSDFERIRSEALDYLEKTLRYASDEELAKAALYGTIFAGTGYEHPVQGTVAGLKAITLDDVKTFYRHHYTQDRVVFGMGGGYDQGAVAALENTRAMLPVPGPGIQGTPAPTPRKIDGRQVILVDKKGADASISMGFPISVTRGEKDFYALWIATSWLGEHRNSSSHLYQVIRAERGLNYGDYAYVEAFPEGGFRQMPPTNVARRQQIFEIWIRTLPNDKAVFAVRAALRELRELIDEGMTEEEFELTRTFLKKYVRHFAPTTDTRLGYAVDDRFYGISDGHLDRFITMMDQLTLDDVNQALKKHLQYDDMVIAMVTGEPSTIEKALVGGQPSTITYPVAKPDTVLADDKKIVVEPLNIQADKVRTIPLEDMFAR